MRTFTTPFLSQLNKRSSRPYLVLQIDWYVNSEAYKQTNYVKTRYYIDRPLSQFDALAADRCPGYDAGLSKCRVVDWGSVKLSLREGQVGAVDDLTIKLEDTLGEIRGFLDDAVQQREVVKIYRMWDEDDVVWDDDKALIFAGAIKPYSWSEADNTISIPLEDISRRIMGNVGLRIDKDIFPNCPLESRGKMVPVVWGKCERVEAVLISAPWSTRTAVPIPASSSPPFTVQIASHPDEIGIGGEFPGGTVGSPIEIWINGDKAEGYVSASGTPDTTDSTVTITGFSATAVATATISQSFGFSPTRSGVIQADTISPAGLYNTLASDFPAGADVEILVGGSWVADTIATITPDSPTVGSYEITLTTHSDDFTAGQPIRFLNSTAQQKPANSGAQIRSVSGATGPGKYIYAVNALPSKSVTRVEGFGKTKGAGGGDREDFVYLGGITSDELSGTVEVTDFVASPYTVNLNDNTWETELGRRITTITFDAAPSMTQGGLRDDRIWVTLDGIEDQGDATGDLITNPAGIIAEYLQNDNLMAVADEFIDASSFNAVAGELSTIVCGFAQIDNIDGLALLQDIARQCRCVLFFDQGKIRIKRLSNTSPGHVVHFNRDKILENSLEYTDSPLEELTTMIIGTYRRSWDDIYGNKNNTHIEFDSDMQQAYGNQPLEMPLWIYRRFPHVSTVAQFYLTRYKRLYRNVKFKSCHEALKLQPGDWVKLSYFEGQIGNEFAATFETDTLAEITYTDLVSAENPFGGGKADPVLNRGYWVTSTARPFKAVDVGRTLEITSCDLPLGSLPTTFGGTRTIEEVVEGCARLNVHVCNPVGWDLVDGTATLYEKDIYWLKPVTTGDFTFDQTHVGRYVLLKNSLGVSQGAFKIKVVRGGVNKVWLGEGLSGSSETTFTGTAIVAIKVPFDLTDCEVVEVTDGGPEGIFDIMCRQPMTANSRVYSQKK